MSTLESAGEELVFIVRLCQVWSVLLLVPFLGWGIYTLRLRYRRHAELAPAAELLTLAVLIVFYAFELPLIGAGTRNDPALFVLATFGLFGAGIALYAPMVVSLASQTLADQVIPRRRANAREPSYNAAEMLERRGDYEGAAHEYMVVSRAFPKDPIAMIRIGDNLMKLAKPEQAAHWFKRGIAHLNSAERNLTITNRLVEIYTEQLGRPKEAIGVLETYLERFPEAVYADSVRRRLERLTKRTDE